MNENELSAKLMDRMRVDMRGAKIVKHNDRSTSGVPDISASWLGFTNWIEDKLWRPGRTLKSILKSDQLISCHEFAVTTHGRCWVVVYQVEPKQMVIWQPRCLLAQVFHKVILGENKDPTHVHAPGEVNLAQVVKVMGAIRLDGWHHEYVTKLIADAL